MKQMNAVDVARSEFEEAAAKIGYKIPHEKMVIFDDLAKYFEQEKFEALIACLNEFIQTRKIIKKAEETIAATVINYKISTELEHFELKYSRNSRSLRAIDRFAIQFAIIARGINLIGQDDFVEVYRSLLYGDGKGGERYYCTDSDADEEKLRYGAHYFDSHRFIAPEAEALEVVMNLAGAFKVALDMDHPFWIWITVHMIELGL